MWQWQWQSYYSDIAHDFFLFSLRHYNLSTFPKLLYAIVFAKRKTIN